MRQLGLIDLNTSDECYTEVARKLIQEQEDRNDQTDKLIDYNDEIISIEDAGEMETMDITVTGDSLFYCNDILTKNSIGLAATCDIMCSIWQEEEDKELGRINIGIIKNRFGPNYGHGCLLCNYDTLTLSETPVDPFEVRDDTSNGVANELTKILNATEDE